MSSESPRRTDAIASTAARPRKVRRFRTDVRGMIVAVVCCGVLSWAARRLWEGQHSAIEVAHRLRSPDPADRVGAARQLQTLLLFDPDRVTSLLLAALDDPEAEVRVVAAEALGGIRNSAASAGPAPDSVRAAVS